jgi:hypothetical protein
MRFALALVVVGAALALPTAAAATIRPQHGMSGVVLGMTKAQVQAKLGRPIGQGGGRWYYARVWVGFRGGRVTDIATTRSTERLANGLGVDSTEAQVRGAFPRAVCAPWSVYRRCRFGLGRPGTRVTDFTIARGRVLQITISLLPG